MDRLDPRTVHHLAEPGLAVPTPASLAFTRNMPWRPEQNASGQACSRTWPRSVSRQARAVSTGAKRNAVRRFVAFQQLFRRQRRAKTLILATRMIFRHRTEIRGHAPVRTLATLTAHEDRVTRITPRTHQPLHLAKPDPKPLLRPNLLTELTGGNLADNAGALALRQASITSLPPAIPILCSTHTGDIPIAEEGDISNAR